MQGGMQHYELTLDRFLTHAARWHANREVVTRSVEGPITRTTYRDIHARALRLSEALVGLGVKPSDRVATLAWNTSRHLEAWYGAMGAGGVYHTINPRLHLDQITWIAQHAESKVLLVDLTFVEAAEAIGRTSEHLKHIIVLCERGDLPRLNFASVHAYEDLIAGGSGDFVPVQASENDASGLCYTSGTTGDPKGVLYSHRSSYLHTLSMLSSEVTALRERDTALIVVPMFHVNAWGMPFAAPAAGAKIVFPGAKMDGASLFELIESEGVTMSAAVPTVWLGLIQYMRETGRRPTSLERVLVGGAACPEVIIRTMEQEYGVEVGHAWGMTETSSAATSPVLGHFADPLSADEKIRLKLKQGRPFAGVDLRLVDDAGAVLPHDAQNPGYLQIKSPSVVRRYFKQEADALDDGWFDTGDVATICPHGMVQLTDRAKDVIKSGGEWISSIELENIALGHPKVERAAVVGVPHPKWDERPLLILQLKLGEQGDPQEFLEFYDGKVAKWSIPDSVLFFADIPLGPTGKIDKKTLRKQINTTSPAEAS